MGHSITKCAEHDKVITQCRCPGPKQLIRVPCPTPRAHEGKPNPYLDTPEARAETMQSLNRNGPLLTRPR